MISCLKIIALVAFALTAGFATASTSIVVVDRTTGHAVVHASVFDCRGHFIGMSNARGRISCATTADFPLTIRSLGYNEAVCRTSDTDTIFLTASVTQLPEIVVESKQKKLLHIVAYVREYSTLSTYTDTVTMFREKTVDFMLPLESKTKLNGWQTPRVINSKSYYRFTNAAGLDSVSDRCNNHFTWSDWVGIVPPKPISARLNGHMVATDTIRGRYSAAEIWVKDGERVSVDIDVLADSTCRRWVPKLSRFFRNEDIDFEQLRLRLMYDDTVGEMLYPANLTGYSFNIDSRGRGRGMFRFNRYDEPFFVTTYTEVYVLDREYISIAEAKKWESDIAAGAMTEVCQSDNAPDLQPDILRLIARVENIDHDSIRLALPVDKRIGSRVVVKRNFAQAVFQRLKGMFGIDQIAGKRKQQNNWLKFRREQMRKNNSRYQK